MNRVPLMMGAGAFEMAPLSDFVVTETKYGKKNLPVMDWLAWRETQTGFVDFNVLDPKVPGGKTRVRMKANRPTDVEVLSPAFYELEWADDPE